MVKVIQGNNGENSLSLQQVENSKGKEHRLVFFFSALLLFLLIYPFFENFMIVLIALISLKILTGTFLFTHDKRHFFMILVFSLPYLIFSWLGLLFSNSLYVKISLVFSILFYATAAIILLYHVFKSKYITHEEIFALLSVYLVFGFGWASAYSLLESLIPSSFSPVSQGALDFVYYSFSTLTTLGFGDITPITNHARSLSILEGVAGVLFIAVMIARFITLYNKK